MPEPLSQEEIVQIREARDLSDTMNTPGWKVYARILETQRAAREPFLMKPLHELNPVGDNFVGVLDGVTRIASLEYIKGAYYGLTLALTTPQAMLDEANRLRESLSPADEEK